MCQRGDTTRSRKPIAHTAPADSWSPYIIRRPFCNHRPFGCNINTRPRPRGFGSVISHHRAEEPYATYPQFDAVGNTIGITDTSENLIAAPVYTPFGKVIRSADDLGNTLSGWGGEQGYMYFPDLDLYYVRQRWYDPSTRQWLSPDPTGVAGDDTNLYRYVKNSPVSKNDPSGLGAEMPKHLQPQIQPAAIPENAMSILGQMSRRPLFTPSLSVDISHFDESIVLHDISELPTIQPITDPVNVAKSRRIARYQDLLYFEEKRFLTLDERDELIDLSLEFAPISGWQLLGGIAQVSLDAATAMAGARGARPLTRGMVPMPPRPIINGAAVDYINSGWMRPTLPPASLGGDNLKPWSQFVRVRSANSTDVLLNTGIRVGPEFNPAKLQRIIANLERRAVTVEIGTDAAMRTLAREGANGAYMSVEGGGILLLKPNATRLEVVEELMHIGQHRATGWAGSGTDALRQVRWELDAQPRLLDLAKRQNWTPAEIDRLRANYLRWLDRVPGVQK